MIIGIVGKKGSGKTTAAEIAAKRGYIPLAFADAIKNTASKVFNIPLAIMHDPIAKDNMQISVELNETHLNAFLWALSSAYTPLHPDAINDAVGAYRGPSAVYTPRQLLQVLGTELVRDCVDKEYWLKAILSQTKPGGRYVIHDVRFQNECDFIKNKLGGTVIVIQRPGYVTADTHASEQLTPESYDFLINNNSSLSDLKLSVLSNIELAEYTYGQKV
jgi:hypothetical protein